MLENARKIIQKNYTCNQTSDRDDMDILKSLWADIGMLTYEKVKEYRLTDAQQ